MRLVPELINKMEYYVQKDQAFLEWGKFERETDCKNSKIGQKMSQCSAGHDSETWQ